jgi:hypothetical protein
MIEGSTCLREKRCPIGDGESKVIGRRSEGSVTEIIFSGEIDKPASTIKSST